VATNVVYYNSPGFNPQKHILDIFSPKDLPNAPVLFFIHGGGWTQDDKNTYPFLGRAFAQQGFVTVVINYRLTPEVVHPGHIQDVARAFAWVYKNISQYGGNATQVFVTGHSAGGHLAALLALNKRYLQAEGLSTDLIKGALPISGIYNVKTHVDAFPETKDVFTSDPDKQRDASPVAHVSEKQPPFLICYAQSDLPTLDTQAMELAKLLQQKGTEAQLVMVPNVDHIGIIVSIGTPNDLMTELILRFVRAHLK
jgi:acetyl esterase/lipase